MSNGMQRSPDMDGEIATARSEQGAFFPLSMLVQVLSVAVLIFTVIPYFGITLRPAERTDLGWWRDGLILDGIVGMEEMHKFQDLGFTAVKLAYPYSHGPDTTLSQLLKDIHATGMKVVVTLAVDDQHKDNYQALQVSVDEWLAAGVDGISLSVSDPFVPSGSISLQNLTAVIRGKVWRHVGEVEYNRKTLLLVESGVAREQEEALRGGADVVRGSSLCSPDSSMAIAQHVERSLTVLLDKSDTVAAAWGVCTSAQSSSLLNLLSLLLPGATFTSATAVIPKQHLAGVEAVRKWPAIRWGTLEAVVVTDNIFSYIIWAKGRMYDKLMVVVNFSSQKVTGNYVKKLDKFKVPSRGKLILVEGDSNREGQVVDMDQLMVNGRELLVIQFPALGV